jgi:arylsulfatase A-like enzyme
MSESFRVEDCLPQILNEGVAFIDRQVAETPEKPFFLYLPLTGPHTPWMPAEQFRGKTATGLYGDFVLNIDHTVEQIRQALIRNGIEKNTLLIFSSDNGAYWPQEEIELFAHDSNQGRKGQKGDVWDGGHRAPLIVSWPEKIKESVICNQLVSLTDLFATFCHLTGQKPEAGQAEDSFSFWHILNGESEKTIRESMVHHSSGGYFGIRLGDWKYIDGLGSGGFSHPSKLKPEKNGPSGQLYNLKKDAAESTNLFFQFPEKVDELKALMEEIIESGHIQIKE